MDVKDELLMSVLYKVKLLYHERAAIDAQIKEGEELIKSLR